MSRQREPKRARRLSAEESGQRRMEGIAQVRIARLPPPAASRYGKILTPQRPLCEVAEADRNVHEVESDHLVSPEVAAAGAMVTLP